jgi:transposase InsO family protein
VVLVDAQGRRIATEGEVDLALSVGHKKVKHTFVVARVTSDILLGMDFMRKFGCVVDFSRMQVKLCGQWLPLQLSHDDSCKNICSVEVMSEVQDDDTQRLASLRDLWQRSGEHLAEDQKTQVWELLFEFQDVFSLESGDLGRTSMVKHSIDTGSACPIKQAPRRLPFAKREVARKEVQDMLDQGLIEPASGPWASPVVLVEKKAQAVNLVRVQGLDLIKAQEEDLVLGEIMTWRKEGAERPPWSDVSRKSALLKAYWAEWDAIVVKDGLLCRKWQTADGRDESFLPIIPTAMQDCVLDQVHNSPSAAHFGRKKTLSMLKDRYYWINRNRSVREWCQNCRVCAGRKGPRKRQHGPAQLYLVGAPMERIAIDIVGPLPVTEHGNKYMLVAMDYFTKWPEVYAIPDQEAVTVARALVEGMFCRFGAPMELHSDQGRNFESNVFAEVCRLFGVSKTRTTPGYPQSDGMVERFNRTLLNALASFADLHQRDWDLYIPFVLLAYRSVVHESTGTSPSMMMLGREVRGPVELLLPRPAQEEPEEVTEYGAKLRRILEEVHERARSCLDIAGNNMKRRYDRSADADGFQLGDAVWLYNPRCKRNMSPKLTRPWEGPYRVIDKITDVVYRVQLTPRSKPRVVNRYRLWRVTGKLPEDWWEGSGGNVDGMGDSGAGDNVSVEAPDDERETEALDLDESDDEYVAVPVTRYGRTVRKPGRYLT